MTSLDKPVSARPADEVSGEDGDPPATVRQVRRVVRRPAPSRRLSWFHRRQAGRPEAWRPARTGAETRDGAAGTGDAGTPLGILIVGSGAPAAGALASERVTVRLLRQNPGTSLVVLPSWREAIAVAVPTEQLLAATGLAPGELATAQLTVVINPAALHDRDLGLREWRAETSQR